jgi:hypothetical protein
MTLAFIHRYIHTYIHTHTPVSLSVRHIRFCVPEWDIVKDQPCFGPHSFSCQSGTTRTACALPVTSASGASQSHTVTVWCHCVRACVRAWHFLMQRSLKCRETSEEVRLSSKKSKLYRFSLSLPFSFRIYEHKILSFMNNWVAWSLSPLSRLTV